MTGNSNKGSGFSLLAGFGNSGRNLIISLALIVLLVGFSRAYLFLQFKDEVSTALNDFELSSLRNSHIFSIYQLALESYTLSERAVANPADQAVLRQSYNQKTDSIRTAKGVYLALLDRIPEKPHGAGLMVNRFFQRVDTLLAKTNDVFNARTSTSGKLLLGREGASLFRPEINSYFRRLRQDWQALTQIELALNAHEFSREKRVIGLTTERWFAESTVLFVIALALTIIIIMLMGRTTSLARQLSAVLEHYSNPIEVANPSGTILYVNSEFEQWTGLKRSDIVGTACFPSMRFLKEADRQRSLWEVVQASIERGETWTGEVEIKNRPGVPSSLIAFPVFNRKGRVQQVIGLHHDSSEKQRLALAVEKTREQYQRLIESLRDGIVVVQDDKLVFANPAAVRIFQYDSEEEMHGLSFIDTIAPPSRPFLHLDYLHRSAGEEILKNYEMKGLTKRGKLVDLELDARAIIWNDRQAMHASFRDISARKALERQQAIWLWEQESLSSIDRQLLGIVDLDKVLDIILQQVTLLTRSQFAGIAMIDVEARQGHWRATKGNRSPLIGNGITPTPDLIAMLNTKDHVILEDFRSDKRFPISSWPGLGAEEIISVAFFPLTVSAEPRGLLVIGFRQPHRFVDREMRVLASMAEKVSIALSSGELYENLLKREKELELLSGARVHAQEEERRRISREIHDGLGQLLTAIKLNLEILEDDLPDQLDVTTRIGEMKQLLDNVLKEAREISYNLMPSVLDDFGLGPGLQSLCEQFSKRSGLKVSFHEHGLADRLSPDIEIGLYRIVQEALNNVAKHAQATEVEVQIVRHKNRLRMTIEDDGKGMDGKVPLKEPSAHGGTGLVSIRERANSFGGTLLIDSSPGKGTLINVEIPMSGG